MPTDHPPDTSPGDVQKLKLRALTVEDYPDIKAIMDAVYRNIGGAWKKRKYTSMINRFPGGQICITDGGKVIAAAFSMIVHYEEFGDKHTYAEITDDAWLTHHDPNGDVLYGVDVFVDPEYRNLRLGRRLYDARKELCRKLNLRAIVAGGRIPRYGDHAATLSPHEYIEAVRRKEIYDPILTFQLSNDFVVKSLLEDYLPEDEQSHGYATLLEWTNIYYKPKRPPLIGGRKRTVRIGTVQWQMRPTESLEHLMQQVEFFIDAMSYYEADFVLLPEFFSAPLLAKFNQEDQVQAIRDLAQWSDEIISAISKLAVSYNTNVVAGSLPVVRDGDLYNIAYLCRRDGTVGEQAKLHITPSEDKAWAMEGGDDLKVFETDVGRVGILICYDVEFPEIARLLTEQGMQILFVPFWTDTKNGYLRVRRCSQARAIENECYVAISGSVGNLPKVDNAEIQYAQSAVFSPSDFPFPHDAIMAESTPNTEMTLIVDLDMDKLEKLRQEGSVRNHQDRRLDLYQIKFHGTVEIDGAS